ncbi:MAG: GNAT family N-acetyltransferase [Acidobacteria bacterium]|nr:GNAT family N-acetyltransferase [Acidobacteriota bacterium]
MTIFIEPWWLDASVPGAWHAATVERDGHVRGRLPYATLRRDGLSWCGLPPLTRLLFPDVDPGTGKPETLSRQRLQIETTLIEQLPVAATYEFVLPPHQSNALAWQTAGFDARLQYTFVVDPGTAEDVLWQQINSKMRNVIRRAEERLRVQPLSPEAFVERYAASFADAAREDDVARVGRLATAAVEHGQAQALAAVDDKDAAHAIALFVWDDADYYYYLSARDTAHAELGAVGLLVWTGMRDAARRGLRFDFDGVSSSGRLKFLHAFGGRLASRVVVTRRNPASEARQWLRRLRHRVADGRYPERFP